PGSDSILSQMRVSLLGVLTAAAPATVTVSCIDPANNPLAIHAPRIVATAVGDSGVPATETTSLTVPAGSYLVQGVLLLQGAGNARCTLAAGGTNLDQADVEIPPASGGIVPQLRVPLLAVLTAAAPTTV